VTTGVAVRDDRLAGRRCTAIERNGEMIIRTMCVQIRRSNLFIV
jgi:hypothetical protein